MLTHYDNDSATGEWLIESATLEHVASGYCIEFRNGLVTVDGQVSVFGWANARELLEDAA